MYNPQNAKENGLPPDQIYDGVIIAIRDGKVRDFVTKNLEKWSKPDQNAIELCIEIMVNGTSHNFKKIMVYSEENGTTLYSGDMKKYKKKYDHLPQVQDKVKVTTDGKGFAKLKLD